MTNEQKLIAVVAILPVMADLLEDVKIFRMVKKHGNGKALAKKGIWNTNVQPLHNAS